MADSTINQSGGATCEVAPKEPIFTLAWDCDDLVQKLLHELAGDKSGFIDREAIEDYERRFTAWQEYLGVFAEKRASLDRRLDKQPEIQGVVVRLLLILRRNFDQLIEVQGFTSDNQSRPHLGTLDSDELGASEDLDVGEIPSVVAYSCEAIEEALSDLSQVAVAIRQSSKNSETARARKYASEHLDLTSYEMLSILALETLYPSAPESLIFQLSQSMVDRYARLKLRAFRHEQLRQDIRPRPHTQRGPGTQTVEMNLVVTTLKSENSPFPLDVSTTPQLNIDGTGPEQNINIPWQPAQTVTSANLTQFQEKLDILRRPKSRSGTTVVLAQKNEPPVPQLKNGRRICDWCFTKLDYEHVENGRWTIAGREHYCKDLEPFCCLSEECAESVPTFPSLKGWKMHMSHHHPSWAQHIHWQTLWGCDLESSYTTVGGLAESNADNPRDKAPNCKPANIHESDVLFSAPNKLRGHLRVSHPKFWSDNNFDNREDAISSIIENSIVETILGLDICPLCRMKPKDMQYFNLEHSSSDSDPNVPTEMVNHIGEHLQNIMVLSLRLFNIQNTQADNDVSGGSMTPTERAYFSLLEFSEDGSDSDGYPPPYTELSADSDPEAFEKYEVEFREPPESAPQDWSIIRGDIWRAGPDLGEIQEAGPQTEYLHKPPKQSKKLSIYDYTIGWVTNRATIQGDFILDETYEDYQAGAPLIPGREYIYTFGRIGKHKIVILDRFQVFKEGHFNSDKRGIQHFVFESLSEFPAVRLWLIFGEINGPIKMENIRINSGDIVVGQLGALPPSPPRLP
ncbi:hypothetical protein TWF481_011584 [Arthrobotrys musiformis]|uniref:EF-hand domain-containing protein n=1 Tax=Arthrobotrys musiformis TaxID=47236 RepID=A0AAV9W0N3_9PEZI